MFKIGEFSKLSQVSVKALRHYDALGLLKPARVDRFTGYRYYSADQLPRLYRITGPNREVYLRNVADGVPPEEYVTEIQFPVTKA